MRPVDDGDEMGLVSSLDRAKIAFLFTNVFEIG